MYQEELLYTKSNVWVKINSNDIARIGITDYSQKKLGKVLFVDLPDIDTEHDQFDSFIIIESDDVMKEVCAPLSGKVISVNEEIDDDPSIINHEPYEDGWLIEIEVSNEEEISRLMGYDEYMELMDAGDFDE
jgi:glycine cleavage system H protein